MEEDRRGEAKIQFLRAFIKGSGEKLL